MSETVRFYRVGMIAGIGGLSAAAWLGEYLMLGVLSVVLIGLSVTEYLCNRSLYTEPEDDRDV